MIKTILDVPISGKKILLRVDFNVSRNEDLTISDDARIVHSLPTINLLLSNNNKLILVSHLGQPKVRDYRFSLKNVGARLEHYLPDYKIVLISDFLSSEGKSRIQNQQPHEIILLENIRFYPEEKHNDIGFAQKLASLADIYVNDAFGSCHRPDCSIVEIPKLLPSYAGILLKKEIESMSKIIHNPAKPLVAIIGGAKIKTKIHLLEKLMDLSDHILVGGALANNFLKALGYETGKSLIEKDEIKTAERLLFLSREKNVSFCIPKDVFITNLDDPSLKTEIVKVDQVKNPYSIVDIGPETEAEFGAHIANAHTIIWNGPVGFSEHKEFRHGTDFLYYSITENTHAFSVVGGGDTLAAISKEEYLEKISHLSTGGGAMLEYIEKGTLPGIDALKSH
jgi:phosphoglycerate kinase